MSQKMKSAFNRILLIVLITFLSQLSSACSTVQYYAQGAKGHLALMSQRKPVKQVLVDKKVSDKRKQQLKEVLEIRQFAYDRLKLPQNNSYTSYVELKRKAVSWNVIANPKYSMSPVQTCFPFVGCVSYLVYFSPKAAKREAEKQKKLGRDTHIIESPAYSTLGVFDDPILSTMLSRSSSSTAEVIFHELAHQRLYRKNNSAFNEAFASAVGQEGTRLWLKEKHPEKLEQYEQHLKKRWAFFNLLINTSSELKAWYSHNYEEAVTEKGKRRIYQQLNEKYARLKQSWGGDKRFDKWFTQSPVNNAKLSAIGVYYKQVPEFSRQLKAFNYDFGKFYKYYEKQEEH
ncbi:aminopeptidase [Cocleimonas sp. KMM 6892]|uniref:aminopeptidase n=1 Tax=unclassified Cocleimonas TaxID=2639732 RepID=UPI002DBD65DB|nr:MULTISPECIES: aminopeptidase [unclassified Cocleimonas]MEB8430987.1 aminopeptidase [Cocleimonas sp. KMM 6892]MEC4714241.1 aminopeptidase [Cocleimonas sp. KMM 6895]MEC4743572.1 aminopeptidase [Cocleimonas sp. KMM 6896]